MFLTFRWFLLCFSKRNAKLENPMAQWTEGHMCKCYGSFFNSALTFSSQIFFRPIELNFCERERRSLELTGHVKYVLVKTRYWSVMVKLLLLLIIIIIIIIIIIVVVVAVVWALLVRSSVYISTSLWAQPRQYGLR